MRGLSGLMVGFAVGMAMSVVGLAQEDSSPRSLGTLVVVEKGAASLAIVDAGYGVQVGSVPEGAVTGHEVATSANGKIAFVPVYGNSGVGKPGTDGRMMVAVDIAAKRVIGSLDFGHGVEAALCCVQCQGWVVVCYDRTG